MGSHNHIIHAEVVGKDGAKIQQFFSELFGWSLDTNNPGGYGMSDPETTGVAFGAGGTPDGSSGFATFYVGRRRRRRRAPEGNLARRLGRDATSTAPRPAWSWRSRPTRRDTSSA